jgi:hypothetical protein
LTNLATLTEMRERETKIALSSFALEEEEEEES